MTSPLALCCFENLVVGNQLINRLQDLGYRVHVSGDARELVSLAVRQRPFLVVTDLGCQSADICRVISELRQNSKTSHLPILAFAPPDAGSLMEAAHSAGATLVVVEVGLLQQLPELLDQVLQVE
ncbi:MAG: hypothetical protein HY735_23775 [Verrucomicrobia bacterium]|nr:hypothetical protein [Verrucomicrobiota bacterium]